MIKLFNTTDTSFNSNGDIVLEPLKASVHNEDNGDFYLDLELGLDYSDYLTSGKIITANTPQGTQAFRISDITKTRTKLTLKCWHVYYDSRNYLIADSYVVEKDCQDALTWLNNALEPATEFVVSSDVTTIDSYRCVRTSFCDAIDVILERWGGHLVRDNFHITIKESIDNDYGAVIRYKKNLREITCVSDWQEVVTKILPVGKDGTLLNAVNPSASIYITSSTQYDIPFTKTVSFEQDIEREDYDSDTAYLTALVNDLRLQATAYMSQNCVPRVNYTLKANLDHVTDIGDVVQVIDERLGLSLMTQVIKYTYDCLTKQYTEIEFGNFKKTLSGLIPNITNGVTKTVDKQIVDATSGLESQIQTKSTVSVTQTLSSGTEVGEITVDGTVTKLYAPSGGGGGSVTDVKVDGTSVVTGGVANISLTGKQDTLVSGTNIKTVNSNSLLGSGDVAVQETLVSGTNIKTVNSNSLLGAGDLSVQETLVSGTNIKTINSQSLLGSGNITIGGGGGLSLDDVYPVGSVYMSTVNNSPQDFIGGTWTPINGRFLVAQGDNGSSGEEALNLSAGATGGQKTVTLTSAQSGLRSHTHLLGTHYHTLSSHTHGVGGSDATHFMYRNSNSGSQTRSAVGTSGSAYTWRGTTAGGFNSSQNTGSPSNNMTSAPYQTTSSQGTPVTGGINGTPADTTPHENLPPYLAVYMWQRIA